MSWPGDGIPVSVTCRVLKIARQPYYRWLANPVTDTELTQAYLANALFDAHRDDPEFGYRFLAEGAADLGSVLLSAQCGGSVPAMVGGPRSEMKRRGKKHGVPAPAHDDLVHRQFHAAGPNQLWLTDITEHNTREGRLYMCAVKDVWSNRIVGYSIRPPDGLLDRGERR